MCAISPVSLVTSAYFNIHAPAAASSTHSEAISGMQAHSCCRATGNAWKEQIVPSKTALIETVSSHVKAPAIFLGVAMALAAGAGTASASTAHSASPAGHAAATHTAKQTAKPAAAKHAAAKHTATKHAAARKVIDTWSQVRHELNAQTNPAAAAHHVLPNADRLSPVATSGPQSFMTITPAQYANAATIVKQALAKRMGVRSAVVAVATAMQESTLNNVNYGTSDSLGLFQQRPSCGWGTAQQIMNPSYAADSFLNALREHQAADPGWAARPLWATAQAVQGSAYPYAYAKWESQALHLVVTIAMQVR
jgi:hypothetical protein